MLSSVSSNGARSDIHTIRTALTSISSITAARGDRKLHLLLAASGSVATIKLPLILSYLSKHAVGLSIRIIITSSAARFLNGQSKEQPTLSSLSGYAGVDGIYSDKDEWGPEPWRRGKGILHIELRKWADLLVIAPLSANTMAKICNGICDNLLTSIVRAWDTDGTVDAAPNPATGSDEVQRKKKRIVLAPAMNTAMWRHPVTKKQVQQLEGEWGVNDKEVDDEDEVNIDGGWIEVLRPGEKELACGDIGEGAMMEWEAICGIVERRLGME
ncbi:flavoprotein [Zalerion maritima]|uniref:Flavoprotein n=1 Tax=Zalerion maritima TaxID=339359 RepID=A0AAD5WQK5_9PEZI|nr:flavoprotein [Zalerion maritima]